MAQKGWNYLLTHIIVEVARALGGSFKLVTLAPRTVREMTQRSGSILTTPEPTQGSYRLDAVYYGHPKVKLTH